MIPRLRQLYTAYTFYLNTPKYCLVFARNMMTYLVGIWNWRGNSLRNNLNSLTNFLSQRLLSKRLCDCFLLRQHLGGGFRENTCVAVKVKDIQLTEWVSGFFTTLSKRILT